ncbi:MAG: PLDc N-terminal domain-containing protein [Defluviitaleaceae bacterium]|nr:PLDc N-terminal domain-containing protein [Defluviitaleaceae bacterium]
MSNNIFTVNTDFAGAWETIVSLLPVLIPILIISWGLIAGCIISIVRKKMPFRDVWHWVLIVLLLDLVGPILYFAVGSKMLDETKAKKEEHGGL